MKKLIILLLISLPLTTQALRFPGSNTSYLAAEVKPKVATTAFTVMAWVRTTSNVTQMIWHTNPVGVDGEYFCRLNGSGDIRITVNTGGISTTVATTGGPAPMNKWNHVTCVWDGAFMYIYVNGVSVLTPTAKTGTLGAPTIYRIGLNTSSLFPMIGNIVDLRVYNRALFRGEIKNYYQMSRAPKTGLIHHYPLWSFSVASTTMDIGGQQAHATSTGTTTLGVFPPHRGY